MGKQINYWMEYESFLSVAQKAVELGCIILKEDHATGKVIGSSELSIITPDQYNYCFHFPKAGDIKIKIRDNGSEYIDRSYSSSGNAIIEAGYSRIIDEPERKWLTRARLYCISGYYDSNGEYIPRPDCLTKVYNSLARFVKKVAPYTELTDITFSIHDEDYGREYEYKHKEYITSTCFELKVNMGYTLY